MDSNGDRALRVEATSVLMEAFSKNPKANSQCTPEFDMNHGEDFFHEGDFSALACVARSKMIAVRKLRVSND